MNVCVERSPPNSVCLSDKRTDFEHGYLSISETDGTKVSSTYRQMHLLRYCLYAMEEQTCFSYNIDISNPFFKETILS